MTAPPTGPAQATHPNPPPQQAPAQGGSNIGRFLGLLCGLIAFGKKQADKLRQNAGTSAFALLASPFGTTDLTAILRRITRGLMLAAALHERLAKRAASGRDITPPPLRMPAPRKSATPRPRAQPARAKVAPDVLDLPTPKQIAAMLRGRPLGAVLIEICRDLGVTPGDVEYDLWNELSGTIIDYGGNLCAYITHVMDQALPLPPELLKVRRRSAPRIESQSSPPVPPALATGPP